MSPWSEALRHMLRRAQMKLAILAGLAVGWHR